MNQDKAFFYLFLQLTLVVSNLPPLTGLKCYIHGKERVTSLLSGNVVKCWTPPEEELPSISSNTGMNWTNVLLFPFKCYCISELLMKFVVYMISCFVVYYLRNRKHAPCFYGVIETWVEVWVNEKCCLNRSRQASVSTAFWSSPKLPWVEFIQRTVLVKFLWRWFPLLHWEETCLKLKIQKWDLKRNEPTFEIAIFLPKQVV